MIKKLYKLEEEITEILETNPITRTDDHLLYIAYWGKKAFNVSFLEFWKNPKRYGASSFSAVERCRRKIQEKRPELKQKECAEHREELEMAYIQYAIGG